MIVRASDLAVDEVHVWQADLKVPARSLDLFQSTLSTDELARVGRFHFQADRIRFTAAHGIVRNILCHYLDTAPGALEFATNEYGKPALAGEFRDALSFNLSHSGELVVIAIAHHREVGIDVEECVPNRADKAVAENYFSPSEVNRLSSLPEDLQPRGFFNCWTRKEAYIKALGMGLTLPLDSFDVSLPPGEPAILLCRSTPADVGTWQLRHLDLGEQYIGALAAAGCGWSLLLRRWSSVVPDILR